MLIINNQNVLICDSRGDKRFSAFHACVNIDGKVSSIESLYQNAKRDENGNIPGKGKPFSYFIWKGKKYKKEGISKLYENLWKLYFKQNPELFEYACQFDMFIDRFGGECVNCQADVIEKLVKESREPYGILVVGSRTFNDYDLLKETLNKKIALKNNVTIVSGGAKGADKLAEQFAKENNLKSVVINADWEAYGKSAGYRRNVLMHKYLSSNFKNREVIAFWDGQSKGTAHNFDIAGIYNNKITTIKF